LEAFSILLRELSTKSEKLNVDLFSGALLSNATTPEYRILVKRDRSKAHYAISERSGTEAFDEQS